MKKYFFIGLLFAAWQINVNAQECGIIYVSPTGSSSGNTGTKANPASFLHALSLLSPANSRIWMAAGTYTLDNTVDIPDGVTIEGGFNPTTWVKSNSTPTIINRTAANPDNANLALAAFQAVNRSNFRLQDITINVADANTPSTTVYGVRLSNCSNYHIVRCLISTGRGGNGSNGAAGANGVNGAAGANGQPGDDDLRNTSGRGGAGGAGGGGTPGGTGGVLGPGVGLVGVAGGNAPAPANNRNGGGGGGGGSGAHDDLPGGRGGQGSSAFGNNTNVGNGGPGGGGCCDQNNPNCTNPRLNGTAGANGANGANGSNGTNGSYTHAGGFFVPGNGTDGTDGFGGQGGAGGGGGSGDKGAPTAGCLFSGCTSGTGSGGGGGGGGGQGGEGGKGGRGGGGSFPIYIFNSGAGGRVIDNSLLQGLPGLGGIGGAGGIGGNGGAGGARGVSNAEVGCGGNGGAGGRGGNGGRGGDGGQGHAQDLFIDPSGVPPTQIGGTLPGNPPVISVLNSGCVNQTILFQAPVSGSWNFGSGATPATANGAGPIQVVYSSTGRKTIQFAGTTFSEFVDIFNSVNSSASIINAPANPIAAGCPVSFSSSLAGSFYEWKFQGGAVLPDSVAGPNRQTVDSVYFLNPGNYRVVLRVASNTTCCGWVNDTVLVTVVPNTINVAISFQPDTICAGETVTFTASPPGYQRYTFFLNQQLMQQSASNIFITNALQPGDSVRVSAFDGICFTNPSAFAKVNFYDVTTPLLSSNDADNILCPGQNVIFTAQGGNFSQYEFSVNGVVVQTSTSNIFSTGSLQNGNIVTVRGVNGSCRSPVSNAIQVQVVALSRPQTGSDIVACSDDASVPLNATPVGGNWSGAGVSGNTFLPSAAGAGTFSLVYTVFDTIAGCEASDTLIATVNPRPMVNAGSDLTVCRTDASFTLQGFSPSGGSWSGTGVNANGLFEPNQAGIGVFTLVYRVTGACPASDSITVVVHPSPSVSAGNDVSICADVLTYTLQGFSPTGGIWSGTGISPNGTISVSGTGVKTYTYTVTDSTTNCRASDQLLFTVNELPFVLANRDITACENDPVALSASGAAQYAWTPVDNLNNPNIANPIFTALQTTTFTVTGTDNNGCTNTDEVVVTVNPRPNADFTFSNACAGFPVVFTNTTSGAVSSYLWDFGNGISSNEVSPVFTYDKGGNYQVALVARENNCSDTARKTISIPEKPQADFAATKQTLVEKEEWLELQNLSTGASSWLWSFGDGNTATDFEPSHLYLNKGLYTVSLIASNEQGCTDTIYKPNWIKVVEKSALYVPNLFSPNDDGINDIFRVEGSGFKLFELQIFNRWGEKIFETQDASAGWDGYYKGVKVEPGIYTYQLSVTYQLLNTHKVSGTFVLIR
jgi:gliding motility-associated-like protein